MKHAIFKREVRSDAQAGQTSVFLASVASWEIKIGERIPDHL